jgi:hypothetical protein
LTVGATGAIFMAGSFADSCFEAQHVCAQRKTVSVAVLAVFGLLVACSSTAADGPVALRTREPNQICAAARVGGVLVADPTYGLAFGNPGYVQGAIWPYGYSARRESGAVVLIDPSGHVIAREGDRIVAAGGSADDDAVNVDCDIEVNPSPDPLP